MIRKTLVLLMILTKIFPTNCKAQSTDNSRQTLFEIQKSYIDYNVPDSTKFNSFIKRDLEKYFSGRYGEVIVKSELLRSGPTQSGMSYPKYYVWIKIFKGDKLINTGAARLEAIEKKRFDVTDFVSMEEIKNYKKDIYTIFPSTVCEKIKSLL